MKKFFSIITLFILVCCSAYAQQYNEITDDGTFTAATDRDKNFGRSDSIQSQHKEVPKGLKTWTIDPLFGDRIEVEPDTLQHMFMNSIFTTGLRGEYNSLGNAGSPRINRIFIDRRNADDDYPFLTPYDFFITPVEELHFTNTLSPITNVSFNTCGNRTNGEDHFKALFAVNAGKKLGLGMIFDYLYGRGYYSNQSTSHFNYTLYGSYLGDRYQAHFVASTYHQKVAENGGVTNDDYISHPERFNEKYTEEEIPVALEKTWNRNDHHHLYFNQRYSLGFSRKVPMTPEEIEARKFAIKSQQEQEAQKRRQEAQKRAKENGEEWDEEEYQNEVRSKGRPDNARIASNSPKREVAANSDTTRIVVDSKEVRDSLIAAEQKAKEDTTWMKDEYVPVTSFIHTANFDYGRRIFQSYSVPDDYFLNTYETIGKYEGDSIYDRTNCWRLQNTFAVALLEGFNKWAKAGLKAYVTHELIHYKIPALDRLYESFNDNNFYVGGQLSKQQGRVLHYNVLGEVAVAGDAAGDIWVEGDADVNFRLLGDTIQLAAKGFFRSLAPSFYMDTYRSKHTMIENEMDKFIHTRIEGMFSLQRTKTRLRVAIDELKNYPYLGVTYDITPHDNDRLHTGNNITALQSKDPINVLTLQLQQDFAWKIFRWENVFTLQNSSKEEVLALPKYNIYTNLYLHFKIARVLDCDLGADMRYFAKYYAPEYIPSMGQFGVQQNTEVRTKTGGYPIFNLYANFKLKNARFFVMASHVNYRSGGECFLTPHYPINQRLLRFGVSWTFFN